MHLGLTKSRDDKLLQDLLDKKLRVIVVFEDDYLNHIARIAYKDIQQDNYTYRIGKYNIYKGEEWGFCDFCKRNDCYFIVPNETIESGSSEIPKDLEEAAKEYVGNIAYCGDDIELEKEQSKRDFIAGAKWQYQKDRAEFAKLKAKEWSDGYDEGVAKGRRLAEEEQADLFTIVALDAAQRAKEQMMKEAVEGEVIKDNRGNNVVRAGVFKDFEYGDKVRVIVCKKED